MIPNAGCDPKINVVSLGAFIINKLKVQSLTLDELVFGLPEELSLSIDHIILSLDWLFIINAITVSSNKVTINEAN